MDADFCFVVGLVIAAFSIPSILSSFIDRRFPTISITLLLISGGLLYYGWINHPGGYTLEQIPMVFVEVIARFIP